MTSPCLYLKKVTYSKQIMNYEFNENVSDLIK